jgi:integrase-like protein
VLPLRADLAADLATFMAGMSKLAPPFPFSKNRATDALKEDLAAASIPYQTERGYADVHSLRVTFGTSLARAGVPLVEAQRLMRHHDPALTANVYTDLRAVEAAVSVEKLPDLSRGRRPLRATGTSGAPGSDPGGCTLGHTGPGRSDAEGSELAFSGASGSILEPMAAGVGGIG